ncbi:hypothetical protein D3C80_1552030 [compost metagenome]
MLLQQLTNGWNQITGRQPTARFTLLLTGIGVQPDRQAGRVERFHALGQQCADQPGQHIAQTRSGHGRVALMTQREPPVGMGDQAAGALQNHDRCIFFAQCMGRRRAIGLHFGRADTEQPRGFTRMRGDHAILGQTDTFLSQQIQRIGIPDLR